MVGTERLPAAGSTKSYLFYKRGGGGKFIENATKNGDEPRDEEEGAEPTQHVGDSKGEKGSNNGEVDSANTIFTWKNLTYTVSRLASLPLRKPS